jgi:Asp-tRNA(Asn)/Glu-tRNA(Gln) amidotransferase A subunit family amidase/ketopantoate reductase
MKFTIIGTGPIGCTVAAHLIRSGHEVLLCDSEPTQVAAINESGLRIDGPIGTITVPVRAVLPADLPNTLGVALLAGAEHDTAALAELLRERLTPDDYLISLNGALDLGPLTATLGAQRVIAALATIDAEQLSPAYIVQRSTGAIFVGEIAKAEITDRVATIAAVLPFGQPTDNIRGYLWSSAAEQAVLLACSTSGGSLSASLDAIQWRPLLCALAREVLEQCPTRTEAFGDVDPRDLHATLNRMSGSARPVGPEAALLLGALDSPLIEQTREILHSIECGDRVRDRANLDLLATYERTERLGRPLNAVVAVFPAPQRAAGGPLHGIAIAVKDIVDIAGHPRGNGNPEAMRGRSAQEDAPIVAALRAAGADIFAATSLLEYAAGALHPEVPETLNPFDLTRTAGGSSGGSAALVGVGACDVALGTDTGGSIRIPAHYCATVGFKPSFGALPLIGVEPLAPSFDHVGFLGANVALVRQVFTALSSEIAKAEAGLLRIGIVAGQLDVAVLDPEIATELCNAIEKLTAAGCTIVERDGSALDAVTATFDDILLYEAWQVHGVRIGSEPQHYGPETLRLLRSGAEISEQRYATALALRLSLLPAAADIYTGIDVLLTPAVPFVAPATTPPIDTPEGAAEGLFSGVFNVTGDPAIVLPCGWNSEGLPIGLQLAAPLGCDQSLLSAAALIETFLKFERRTPAIS